jgi:hypothetical protein
VTKAAVLADTDLDGDGISNADELAFASAVVTSTSETAATSNVAAPTSGYIETSRTIDGGNITIVATANGENGSDPNPAPTTLVGTQSSFTVDVNPVSTETLEDAIISINIGSFDDGLFISVNGAVLVNFDGGDYYFNDNGTFRATGIVNTKYNLNGDQGWEPWNGEGNPELLINTSTGAIQLMVDTVNGTRENILLDIEQETGTLNSPTGTRDVTPDALPTLDFNTGVTITTAFNNVGGGGSIGTQTITVQATFSGAEDVDGDGIINSLDIDSDGDRIWDRFEANSDADGDGLLNYRDTDSNGNTVSDTVEASLTAGDISGLQGGGTYANQFILLTDAVDLDFTAIADSAFSNVEYLDMNDGANAQTVTLNESEVIALTDADNELIVIGDTNDTINAIGFVETTLKVSIQNKTHTIWESGDARLIIDDEIAVITT